MKIKSVTMTLNDFNLAVGETGMQNNQLEVLKLIIQAFEEKVPILLINESSGRKYKLSEDNKIIEVKT
jgi:acetyl-CoA carboxylase carboxyltransferase component